MRPSPEFRSPMTRVTAAASTSRKLSRTTGSSSLSAIGDRASYAEGAARPPPRTSEASPPRLRRGPRLDPRTDGARSRYRARVHRRDLLLEPVSGHLQIAEALLQPSLCLGDLLGLRRHLGHRACRLLGGHERLPRRHACLVVLGDPLLGADRPLGGLAQPLLELLDALGHAVEELVDLRLLVTTPLFLEHDLAHVLRRDVHHEAMLATQVRREADVSGRASWRPPGSG